jgi:hypothetical protein
MSESGRGRPLGISTESLELWRERDSLSLDEWREELLLLDDDDLCDEDLDEEDLEDDLEEDEDDFEDDFEDDLEDDLEEEERCEEDLDGSRDTSRTLSSRPVVGSTMDSTLGLWATW